MGILNGVQPVFQWFNNFISMMPNVIQIIFTFVFGTAFLIAFLKFLFALFHR